jgi:predicted nucleic acid-binding protein
MSRASLEEAIPRATTIVLDTSVLLAYLNGSETVSRAAAIVLDEFVQTGRNAATISSLTVTETLVRPFAAGPRELETAEDFLMHFPNLGIEDVDYSIAREAGRLRATTNLRTPDALVIATALSRDIEIVVANDAKWAKAIGMEAASLTLCHLDAHVPL